MFNIEIDHTVYVCVYDLRVVLQLKYQERPRKAYANEYRRIVSDLMRRCRRCETKPQLQRMM